jgi:glycosyltransferase involved in cell wall biosynthesis
MRVLLGTAGMAAGGAERVVIELARALSERGDPVAVAADSGPLDPPLEELGVVRFAVPGYGRSPLRAAKGALALRSAIRSFRPTVVHSHNVKATGMMAAARASRRERPPLLATFHGVERREYRSAALILRGARLVVCVSEDLARGLADAGFPRERVRVIRNAVSIPAPLPRDIRESIDLELDLDEGLVVSLVGRLVPQKAPQRFLAAARSIAAEIPDCRFLIVGDGPLRGQLESHARDLGIERAVRFTGIRQDARALIARSDVIAFSSDWEGMSIVALEALAAGVPVVATDVEGMREVLGTGAGVLTSPDPEALAKAILDLLEDPKRRAEMGAVGRDKVAAEFSVERMVRSYQEVYRELASLAPKS